MLDGMTQPENADPRVLTRPAIGVLVDPGRMAAARKSAMLERIELAHLSQALDLAKIATEVGLNPGYHPVPELAVLRKMLTDAGINLKKPPYARRRIGVSRDEIAKLETGGRKRPKITTLRKLIDALNYARSERGKPPLDIEDLQVPGEVLIPEPRGDQDPDPGQWDEMMTDMQTAVPEWERAILDRQEAQMAEAERVRDMLAREADEAEEVADALERQAALDAYQEASNDIYYEQKRAAHDAVREDGERPAGGSE